MDRRSVRPAEAALALPDEVRLTEEQTEQVLAAIADAVDDAALTVDELTAAIVERAGSWAGDLVIRPSRACGRGGGRPCRSPAPAACCASAPTGAATSPTPARVGGCRAWSPSRPASPSTGCCGATCGRTARCAASTSRPGLAGLGADVEQVEVEGVTDWQLAADDVPDRGRPASGCCPTSRRTSSPASHARRLFRGAAAQRALSPSGQAGNYPVLLVDGTVAGVWHLARSGRKATITVEPLVALSARRRRLLDDEVARVGEVLESVVSLVGPVTVGGHA